MALTSRELAALYAQIENKSDKEIQRLVKNETNKIPSGLEGAIGAMVVDGVNMNVGGWLKGVFGSGGGANSLTEICKEYAKEFSSEIRALLRNNPKTTNYAFNVIQLLAPAIAQQYSGIPALAIVGSITLLCRQGIENFIK